jgi:radical SAM superfamily enzyme YgiQ (UPF0313 family)
MVYDLPLFRPPSEGDNVIVQATLGCHYNQCSFCAMYKTKRYQARPLAAVFADIDVLADLRPEAHKVFLADGDAFTLPTEDLLAIAAHLAARFPNLQRISAYATPADLLGKSPDDLLRLRQARLSLAYVGIESGAAEVLRRVRKGASADGIADALTRARTAGIKVSATVILGLGGRRLSQQHASDTARLINRAPPHFLSTLQLMLPVGTAPDFLARWDGDFAFLDDDAVLAEQRTLIAALDPPHPVIFRSNHASNCLALAGTLPRDRGRLLADIDGTGQDGLRPAWLRGL